MSSPQYDVLLKKALNEINSLRTQLAQSKASGNEPIAIVGMGCRFPGGANTPESFWELLRGGTSVVTEIPAERWNVDAYYDADPAATGKMHTRYGCFLDEVDTFEPAFFNIAAREAVSLDPQQRLLLEVSWEALESANIVPASLFDSSTGVFVGISGSSYNALMADNKKATGGADLYELSGTDVSVAAGRIAYTFGFMGPTFAVDTACSSSLVSVHEACQSLRHRECDLAIAGGVGLILHPDEMVALSQAAMLSPDGSCKTFDEKANGYVRGEGCGMVTLKRLSDATAAGDHVLAVINGSMINHDGHSSGLTAPRGTSQVSLIRQTLQRAGVDPSDVSYIEAHGTGTPLGDPIEMDSLHEVFAQRDTPLWVGSVKTNIGHLEAAAGIAGLIKVVLMLQNRQIPGHLNFNTPNPYIDWDNISARVPLKLQAWEESAAAGKARVAGVSSFGFSGTNAHLVLTEALSKEAISDAEVKERSAHLLTLSAKNEKALAHLAHRYHSFLGRTDSPLARICYTANTRRTHFDHRLALSATSPQDMQSQLKAYLSGLSGSEVALSHTSSHLRTPDIAFLFTGQGSQYVDMGRQLFENQPVFRQTLQQCDAILQPLIHRSLLDILYPEPGQSSPINETAYTQPALFAVEYALYQLWKSWGIEPSVVMGHSVGEYVAACVAGVFTLEDGLRLIAERGRLMQALPTGGEMLAVMASEAEVAPYIRPYHEQLSIAAINGPDSVVIAGEGGVLESVIQQLEADGIRSKQLTVSHAFHSPLMEPMLDAFAEVARTVTYTAPRISLISNLTGRAAGEATDPAAPKINSAEYWVQHVRQPVRFAEGVAAMQQHNTQVFLELGPQPTLCLLAQQCFESSAQAVENAKAVTFPSLRLNQDNWQTILETLSQLYVLGIPVNWEAFHDGFAKQHVRLPTYAWARQRFWLEQHSDSPSRITTSGTMLIDAIEQGEVQSIVDSLESAHQLSADSKKVLPEIIRLLVSQHHEQALQAQINDWLYEVVWQPQLLPLQADPSEKIMDIAATDQQWLIFADKGGRGEILAGLLQQQGCSVLLVHAGEAYAQDEQQSGVGTRNFYINPASLKDYIQLFSALPPLHGIVHLWSLDIPSQAPFSVSCETVQAGSHTLLFLIQAAIKSRISLQGLWVVTSDSQSVLKDDEVNGLLQSPVWGMSRVIALEHPELNCVCIDVETLGAQDEQMLHLSHELSTAPHFACTSPAREPHVAWRRGKRYVARFKRYHTPSMAPEKIPIKADATYLITGGLGGLGLLFAHELVRQGAMHLVLTGRSQPGDSARQQLASLASQGVTVTVAQADVSVHSEIAEVIADIDKALPLAGIIHAAGVLDDGVLQQQNGSRFNNVFMPKLVGGWNLHTLTSRLPLDFFVCFSSTAGVLGNPGQANYAAANTFLDSLVHYRQKQGLPGLAINWDAWAEVGMAARLKQVSPQNTPTDTDHRLPEISPELGLKVFDYLLQQPSAQVAVIATEMLYKLCNKQSAFFTVPATEVPAAHEESLDTAGQSGPSISEQLHQASPQARKKIVLSYLQAQVAGVLRSAELPSVIQPFSELGMDSLMSIELKRQLENQLRIQLPATLAYDYPSVDRLTEFLLTHIHIPSDADTATHHAPGKDMESKEGKQANTSAHLDQEMDVDDLSAIEALLDEVEDFIQ